VLALTLCAVTKDLLSSEQSLSTTDSARVAVSFSTLLGELQRVALLYGSHDPSDVRVFDVGARVLLIDTDMQNSIAFTSALAKGGHWQAPSVRTIRQ
jgi:hypothetical protein